MKNPIENKKFQKPFREFLGRQGQNFLIRLGPRIYCIKADLNIPLKGIDWSTVRIKESNSDLFRPITKDELEKPWVQKCLLAEVSYQIRREQKVLLLQSMNETRLRNKRKYGGSWLGRK